MEQCSFGTGIDIRMPAGPVHAHTGSAVTAWPYQPAQFVHAQSLSGLMQVQSRSERDSTSLNTMVFADLVTQRPTDRALQILDLGCVCQSTIDFFSDYHSHILVTGLCDEYIPGKGLNSRSIQQLHQLIELDSKRLKDNHYDLILCWDLFNYLDKEQFQALVAQLQPVLTNKTRCHAFLYTSACRPVRPGGFSITSSEQMLVIANETEQHHADSVTQATLGKYLSNYCTLRTVLMRNGTQELAFESRSSKAAD